MTKQPYFCPKCGKKKVFYNMPSSIPSKPKAVFQCMNCQKRHTAEELSIINNMDRIFRKREKDHLIHKKVLEVKQSV